MDEEQHINTDELLDWLCWERATTGERFFPPRETANECLDELCGDLRGEEYEYAHGKEYGQHGRAWVEAVEFFHRLQGEGYDPVERAERHIRESDLDLPGIDWEWLRESRAKAPEAVEGVE